MTYDYTNYGSSNTKAGNLTESRAGDFTINAYSNPLSSNYISTSATFNSYGMPLTATDANDIETHITYGSIGSFSDLYPTQTVVA